MTRIVVDIDTKASPDQVMAAILDFSERRVELWPGLAPEYYEVLSLDQTSAEIREGSTKPLRLWATHHYDWSSPGRVSWTARESNFCAPGGGVTMTVTRQAEQGSRVHIVETRTGTTLKGKSAMALGWLTRGAVIKRYMKNALDRLADRQDLS